MAKTTGEQRKQLHKEKKKCNKALNRLVIIVTGDKL